MFRPPDVTSAVPVPIPPASDAFGRRMAAAVTARVGAARYQLWFDRHAAFVPAGGELLVGVPNPHFQDWLGATFGDAVRAAAADVMGGPVPVRFVVDPALFGEGGPRVEDRPSGPTGAGSREPGAGSDRVPPKPRPTSPEAAPTRTLFGVEPPPPPAPRRGGGAKSKEGPGTIPVAESQPPIPRPAYSATARRRTLAGFVVGSSNRVAHAAALSAVEEPGLGANPLVLHGPVGTGKTHLLEGVMAGLRAKGDGRPCLTTAEAFTTRFVQAARFGKQGAFRRQFRDCSALLLDDLHFLATKRATQEEFLHTFDALVADGRQVVVTMDCHPRLADELMPELVDRLLGGAVWGVMPPDPDTRLGILRAKAGPGGLPDDVLAFLARTLSGNVRELEGAVHGVRHYSKVTGRPADIGLAREALGDLLRHAVRSVTLADVDAAVCHVLRLGRGTLQSKARAWSVSHPRMIAVYLCRKHTAATYGEISTHFGAKTHSTAVAAEKKVRAWLLADAKLALGDREWGAKDLVDRVERELGR